MGSSYVYKSFSVPKNCHLQLNACFFYIQFVYSIDPNVIMENKRTKSDSNSKYLHITADKYIDEIIKN